MPEYRIVGDAARPPLWRTILYVIATAFGSLVSLVYSPLGHAMASPQATGLHTVLSLFGMIGVVALPVSLFWRHRRPFVILAAACAASLLLPLGNAVPLVALATLLGRRAGPAASLAIAGAAISTTWVTLADWLHQPRGASVFKGIFGPIGGDYGDVVHLGWEVLVTVLALGFGGAVLTGLLVRSRREMRSAHEQTHAARAETSAAQAEMDAARAEASATQEATYRLSDEVARRAERERIAREVHDALGHRLSLLNLHAGALEANAAGDERLRESAQLIREGAGAALDDLRSLLQLLREPAGTETADLPLAKLPEVVGDAFGAGQALSSSIFIEDAESADPALSRAVYRIVQELLTNARKHAPGEHVFLTVTGSRENGIAIDCRNPYLGHWTEPAASGSRGLTGIAERAELLGGSLGYGVTDEGRTFRVTVTLPWRER